MNLRILFSLFFVCLSGNLLGRDTILRLCNSTDKKMVFGITYGTTLGKGSSSNLTVAPHDREHLNIKNDCVISYWVHPEDDATCQISSGDKFCDTTTYKGDEKYRYMHIEAAGNPCAYYSEISSSWKVYQRIGDCKPS